MQALSALLPILLILVLMIAFGWPAAVAGSAGLAVALAVAVAGFGFGTTTHPDLSPIQAIGGALAEAVFVAGTILWIILPALCIFELQKRSGAFEALKVALSRLTDDRRIATILVAWFFALFMEGAAGFGTPVALAAPILVSLGFAPVQAVALALIGHAAGVSFGAVGTPVVPQAAATGLSGLEISRATGLLHAILGAILLVFLVRMAGPAAERSGPKQRGSWGWLCLAAPCFLVPFLGIAVFVGPELPTLGGALIGGLLFIALLRWRHPVPAYETRLRQGMSLWRASLPYGIILVLILATRLIGPLEQVLRDLAWEWSISDVFSGRIEPLHHPGSMLLVGFLLGGILQGRRAAEIGSAVARAAQRVLPVLVALVAMLGLARVMVHAGMIEAMAAAAAAAAGPVWPAMVPMVGVLGTFITGSATASNILFTNFQESAARALGIPVLQAVSGQGFGAAVGNIVCPHNVIAGAATVGLHGREGEVLRRTALVCLCYAGAGGALLFLLVRTG